MLAGRSVSAAGEEPEGDSPAQAQNRPPITTARKAPTAPDMMGRKDIAVTLRCAVARETAVQRSSNNPGRRRFHGPREKASLTFQVGRAKHVDLVALAFNMLRV